MDADQIFLGPLAPLFFLLEHPWLLMLLIFGLPAIGAALRFWIMYKSATMFLRIYNEAVESQVRSYYWAIARGNQVETQRLLAAATREINRLPRQERPRHAELLKDVRYGRKMLNERMEWVEVE